MNVKMLALVGVAGLGAGACVDTGADSGMRILGNVAPGDGCVVDGASTTFQDDGVIEPTSGFGYVFTPAVVNELQIVGDESTGPKTIYITHARVDIAFYDPAFEGVGADASLLHFRVPVAGVIEPGGGKSGFSFEIVPPELLWAIDDQLPARGVNDPPQRTTLDVRIQMVGTRGGGETESNVFRYPVDVCDGCVYVDQGACKDVEPDFQARTGGACNVLQDGFVDCWVNRLVRPAPIIAPLP